LWTSKFAPKGSPSSPGNIDLFFVREGKECTPRFGKPGDIKQDFNKICARGWSSTQ